MQRRHRPIGNVCDVHWSLFKLRGNVQIDREEAEEEEPVEETEEGGGEEEEEEEEEEAGEAEK